MNAFSVSEPAPAQPAQTLLVPTSRRYWAIFLRHRWMVAGLLVLFVILAVLATLLMTAKYTAVARIEVARQSDNVTNVEGVQREETSPSLEFYSTQYALLDTRSLATRVARRLNLTRDEAFFSAHGKSLSGLFSEASPVPSAEELKERERETIDLLLKNLTIAPIRGSALIDVEYTSASPTLSAKIANAWVQEFVAQSQDRRFASTADARAFLEQRLSDLRQKLEKSERDLVNYAAAQNIVRLSETQTDEGRTRTTQTLASSDLEALNGALAGATASRIAAESQLRAVAGSDANAQSISNVTLNQLREEKAKAEAEYAQILVQFEPQYPAARAQKQRIAGLDSAIAREEARVRRSVQTSYTAARDQENALQARVDNLRGLLTNENRASIQYNIYQREVDTNRQLYDALLQRYKEIGVAGVGSSNVAIVDPADIPEKPSSPNLLLNVALGILLGMTAAAATVIVLENLDEGFRDPEQLRERLGLPLLGVIPYANDEEDPLEALDDPKSEIAEAYMTVRTNLSFSSKSGVPKTLAVTSSAPAEGKSTTSLAIARLLARTGRNVVLMDLDMRRPMMDRMIGSERQVGMSNYLAGDDRLDDLLLPTDRPNLTFISAGPIPPSAAELLNSDRLGILLGKLGEKFDHIVIDSAPVLGLSDAPLIAGNVEGVVFVVQALATPARAARHALERISEADSRILGVVLTKYQSEANGYGYGYGYTYKYDRHEAEKASA